MESQQPNCNSTASDGTSSEDKSGEMSFASRTCDHSTGASSQPPAKRAKSYIPCKMLEEQELVLVVVGFIIAFLLAFGIGANDVANSFGTSVGSKVLSLRGACILATVCEISGAILLGGHVSKTIREGIVDLALFNNTDNGPRLLIYGQVSSLASACIWMLVATFFKIPVSGTHSIVGATLGFGLVEFGISGIKWMGVLKIVLSWFISPLLSGAVSVFMFMFFKHFILKKERPLEPALRSLPFIYGCTVIVNVFSVLFGGIPIINLKVPVWIVFVASFGAGLLTALIVQFLVVPYLRRKVLNYLELLRKREEEGYEDDGEESWFFKMRLAIVNAYENMLDYLYCRKCRKHRNKNNGAVDAERQITNNNHLQTIASDEAMQEAIGRHDELITKSDLRRSLATDSTLLDRETPEKTVTDSIVADSYPGSPTRDDNQMDDQGSEVDVVTQTNRVLVKDRPEEARVFSFAQILTATFGSFVHGGNDVSNAIGPLIGMWMVTTTGSVVTEKMTPVLLLVYGGVGISIGLWVWGRKVIQTIGEDLTTITPSSGVCIELGSAVTVLVASKVGIPVSTTHCKVGSIVVVGRARAKEDVNWKLFLNIIIAWVVTLPVSAGISALVMYIFTHT
ncbi:hypothetical protein SprV_0200628800 [Sparganum proliferum]